MNKKIVTIIILATIVIGAVAFGGYLLKKKMLSAPISQETIESTNKNTEVVKIAETVVEDTRTYQEKEPNMKTVAVIGKVTEVTLSSIEIINGEVKNTFPITDKVLVVSINTKDSGNKKITDIKKDDEVAIVLNVANSEVVGIQIN